MSKRSRLVVRFALSGGVALIVTVIAIFAAWLELSDQWGMRRRQGMTELYLAKIDEATQQYIETSGRVPTLLSELAGGEEFDGWDRPFQYSANGTTYSVVSLGRDGERGGVGLDCDYLQDPLFVFSPLLRY